MLIHQVEFVVSNQEELLHLSSVSINQLATTYKSRFNLSSLDYNYQSTSKKQKLLVEIRGLQEDPELNEHSEN